MFANCSAGTRSVLKISLLLDSSPAAVGFTADKGTNIRCMLFGDG